MGGIRGDLRCKDCSANRVSHRVFIVVQEVAEASEEISDEELCRVLLERMGIDAAPIFEASAKKAAARQAQQGAVQVAFQIHILRFLASRAQRVP